MLDVAVCLCAANSDQTGRKPASALLECRDDTGQHARPIPRTLLPEHAHPRIPRSALLVAQPSPTGVVTRQQAALRVAKHQPRPSRFVARREGKADPAAIAIAAPVPRPRPGRRSRPGSFSASYQTQAADSAADSDSPCAGALDLAR